MLDGLHPCAAPGCTEQLPAHLLMCRAHWRQVPLQLQRLVNQTWRRVRHDPEAYRSARAQAIASVSASSQQGGLF